MLFANNGLCEPGTTTRTTGMDPMDERDRNLTDRGVENNLRGTGNDLKGRIKDAAGGLTGDGSLQAEGKLDRVKGKAQNVVGDIQRKLGKNEDPAV